MTKEFDRVLRVVAEAFDVTATDIRSSRRSRQVVPARLIAAYLARKVTGKSSADISRQLGGRDYTNIEMYCRAVTHRAAQDPEFSDLLQHLDHRIRGGSDQGA